MSFIQEFDDHSVWRREKVRHLQDLADWLDRQELLDAGTQERLKQLQERLGSDKVMVAFVAEFSRGKSELINAVFFAGYGRRIMPASAGRTTMCPTELGYDDDVPPCLRLLPIETRLQPQSLLEWRSAPDQWERLELDVNDPEQLAQAMVERARLMGAYDHFYPDAAFSASVPTHYVNLPHAATLLAPEAATLQLPVGEQHARWQWLHPHQAEGLVHPYVRPYVQALLQPLNTTT